MCTTSEQRKNTWHLELCSSASITFFVALPHEATQGKTIIKIQTPESEHCQKTMS